MSFNAGSISGSIYLDATPAIRAEKAVIDSTVDMKRQFDRVNKDINYGWVNAAEKSIAAIKGKMGKNSLFGEAIELAAGGGAIAGVAMAAREFESLTGGVAETVNAYRRAELAGNTLAGQMLRQVPVLGTLTRGFDNLRDAVTGERVEMERNIAYAKASEDAWSRRVKLIEESKAATLAWAEVVRNLNAELEVLSAAPEKRSIVQAEVSGAMSLEDLGNKYVREAGFVDTRTGGDGEYLKKQEELNKAIAEREGLLGRLKSATEEYNTAQAAFNGPRTPGMQNIAIGGRWENAKKDYAATAEALQVQAATVANLQTEMDGLQKKADAALQGYMGAWVAQSQINTAKFAEEMAKVNEVIAKAKAEGIQQQEQELNSGRAWADAMAEAYQDEMGKQLSDLQRDYAQSLQDIPERQTQELPINTVAAREFMGGRVVTAADLPAGREETAESARRTAKATEQANVYLLKLLTFWQNMRPGQLANPIEVIQWPD